MSRTITALAAVTAAAALALPAAAQAHVTLNPKDVTAGAFTKLDIRVPTERSNASTVKLAVQFPDGFAAASYEPRAGWSVRVTHRRLATPVQTDDGPITEGVRQITWTGTRHGLGRIAPGQFMEFPISVQIPENAAGKTLTFKAIQTYSNGEVVRWIGPADADTPAPTLQVAAAASGASGHGASTMPASTPASHDEGSSGGDAIGVVALIVGGLGLAAASVALVVTRRRPGRADRSARAV